MDRSQQGHDFGRNADNGHGDVQKEVNAHESGDGLPQCTRQIELFTTVMNDVPVPEQVYLVIKSMRPVTGEVKADERQDVQPNGRLD